MRDPYELLGVSRGADESEIKAAFRRRAAQHHPDRNPGDPDAPARFKELNQAYQILGDPERRRTFDRFGEAAFRPGGVGPDLSNFGGLEDLFGDLLGAFGFHGRGEKGNLRQSIQVSFEEAAKGCVREVRYDRVDVCGRCVGRGAEPETPVQTCAACGGRGRVKYQQPLLPLSVERTCSRCQGRGQIPEVACTACRGRGLEAQQRKLRLEIPAGIEAGSVRVVEEAGNRNHPQRPPGDLEIVVEVARHDFFKRVGDDVTCKIPISFSQATLGGEVEVPTLDGKVRLRIPPATQVGSVLRIRGKGIAHRLRSGRGDQLVEVSVEIPSELTDRARTLVEDLGRELGETVQPQQAGFMERLKSLFG